VVKNVLSLFDGISCGQIALNRAGIKYDKYFASEIDKYAIKVTQTNFPDTIQLGDITQIKGADLPKIDLLIGGSPCQGFSFAGKQLNFNDPRSALFFEYVRLLRECEPTYFLLENVVMKKEYQDVISGYLGVEPIMINSSLVSAQNRKRLYWTNIPNVKQPEDRKITLRDVLKSWKPLKEKSQTILSTIYKENAKSMLKRRKYGLLATELYYPEGHPLYVKLAESVTSEDTVYQYRRTYVRENKSGVCPTLTANMGTGGHNVPIIKDGIGIRKLTPVECERLQTIDENYTSYISNSQRYKCIGNGWTVEVIAHILKEINKENQ
jgi:DNA-cytosine methyltransferase